jgi:hypothetical protein
MKKKKKKKAIIKAAPLISVFRIGDSVRIKRSEHQSIRIGEVGKIHCFSNSGAGVQFTKKWGPIVSHDMNDVEATRVVYFELDWIEHENICA